MTMIRERLDVRARTEAITPEVQPRLDLSLPPAAEQRLTVVRVGLLLLSGAMPVTAIPLYVLGWLPMRDAALFLVAPLAVAAAVLMFRRSPEAVWAARGFAAGLVAVTAYDGVRMPLVWLNIWPDFIPRVGGWVTGHGGHNAAVGYAWRYLGDGGGIGLAFFVFCGVALAVRPALVMARPVALAIGYGVFIWSGLLATVAIPARGETLLFRLTPVSFLLSLLGHLIYGTVLGLFLRHHVRPSRSQGGTGR